LFNLITDQWFWLAAAAVFAVLLALILAYGAHRSKSQTAKHNQADGWAPTGRIDFAGLTGGNPDATGDFLLQAEDTRTVNSIGGVDHREIRWRKATLNEAKRVVLAYHAHRSLAITGPG
jgi:hypothetical protein